MLDDFIESVDLISELIGEKYIFISLATVPGTRITFETDGEALEKGLRERKISGDFFREAGNEIAQLMAVCLTGWEESFKADEAKRMEQANKSQNEIQKELELINRKLAIVHERLISEDLKQRFALKKRAREQGFLYLDWDVNITHFQNDNDIPPLTYISCQIGYQKARPVTEFDRIFGRKTEALNLEFTKAEIEHLIKTLNTMQDALENIGGSSDVTV